jgi:uncharacterized glyoxalase superfamily protein PhnB
VRRVVADASAITKFLLRTPRGVQLGATLQERENDLHVPALCDVEITAVLRRATLAGQQDKVMHGSITIGEQVLLGADVAPNRYEEPRGFSLSLQMTSTTEADRIFHMLGRDGTVVMPLEKTFWADRFGVLIDRFGIRWLINCEKSDPEIISS